MTLQEQFQKDLAAAMKAKDEERKNAIRVIMGEFSRAGKKTLTDDEVVGILKKLLKSEKELLAQKGEETSGFLMAVAAYLPPVVSPEEISRWIDEHVDFSAYKNKMQAMGPIMKHFGAGVDGNLVRKVLQDKDG